MRPHVLPAVALTATLAAGCAGDADDPAGPGPATATLQVAATDGLRFEPADLSAPAGTVTVELGAGPGVGHTFVVDGVDGDRPVVEADAGETASGTVELAAGRYTVYCSVPGHREAGMEASLAVS